MALRQTYLGCISGTSVDGLDIACIAVEEERIEFVAAETVELPEALRQNLLTLGQPGQDDVDLLGHVDAALGDFIGAALVAFMERWRTAVPVAIGSHGQTVRHRPEATAQGPGFSLQIGDPNRIAERTGITIVADFRRRDMAAGGQGAPLVPPFHKALFTDARLGANPVILNIGGISNVSILDASLSGFDTGPGNCLMDSWILKHQQKPVDLNGSWASSGDVKAELLSAMLQDPYFSASPPKSTGREYFNLAWIESFEVARYRPQDVQATLAELTARCTVDALGGNPTSLVICGGGRHNRHVLSRFRSLCGYSVFSSEDFLIDGDAIEAAAFAWLAHCRVNNLAMNAPAVTGAHGERILGAVYPA